MPAPLIIIDAANVVGSRPDGWWRDRIGATQRLRDRLRGLASNGIDNGPGWAQHGPLDIVMVVEGKARGVESSATVTTLDAPGQGDDTIFELAAQAASVRHCLVITSDRQLRQRVTDAGANVASTGSLTRKYDEAQ